MVNILKSLEINPWNRIGLLITLICSLFFIIVSIIAMFYYPGGYSFFGHYFSYLGTLTTTKTNLSNRVSMVLFIIACVIWSVALISFWLVFPRYFIKSSITRYIGIFGSISGEISSPFLIALSIFPYDITPVEHAVTTNIFFFFFAIAVISYSINIILTQDYNIIHALFGLFLSVITILGNFKIFSYVKYQGYAIIEPMAQKIIIYGLCLWIILQIIILWKKNLD